MGLAPSLNAEVYIGQPTGNQYIDQYNLTSSFGGQVPLTEEEVAGLTVGDYRDILNMGIDAVTNIDWQFIDELLEDPEYSYLFLDEELAIIEDAIATNGQSIADIFKAQLLDVSGYPDETLLSEVFGSTPEPTDSTIEFENLSEDRQLNSFLQDSSEKLFDEQKWVADDESFTSPTFQRDEVAGTWLAVTSDGETLFFPDRDSVNESVSDGVVNSILHHLSQIPGKIGSVVKGGATFLQFKSAAEDGRKGALDAMEVLQNQMDDFDSGFSFDPEAANNSFNNAAKSLVGSFAGQVPVIGEALQGLIWGSRNSDFNIEVAFDGELNGSERGDRFIFNEGNNVFSGGDGVDVLVGLGGDDIFNGGADRDALFGGDGDDILEGDEGNDLLHGGFGEDTAVYSGDQSSYTLMLSPTATTVTDRRSDGNGTDTLIDIELLDFDIDLLDGPFDLTQFGGTTGLSGQDFESFIELYIAYFNRAPDAIGLNFWGTAFSNGTSLEEMATLFIDQEETEAAYPSGTTNDTFATTVYDNVLGRTPDQNGFDFWVGQLDSGNVSRDQFILEVLRGVQPGSPDRSYLDDKVDIGAYFAVHKGMSDTDNAAAVMELFDDAGMDAAAAAIDGHYAEALDPNNGEFLMQLVGVLDDPFAVA